MNDVPFHRSELKTYTCQRPSRSRSQSENTYHERLVEREHDDEFDGQEFGERASSSQFFLSEAVKQQQSVQRNTDASEVAISVQPTSCTCEQRGILTLY